MSNGHGGARVGAGRKPQKPPFVPEIVVGGRTDPTISSVPPKDLPADQAEFWATYAARAITAGTLTHQTEANFRLLCELDAEKRATKATIDRDGRTYLKAWVDSAGQEHQELKAHPLKSDYAKLVRQVDALMARFQLAPFGKPVAGARPKKPVANPWVKVEANAARA